MRSNYLNRSLMGASTLRLLVFSMVALGAGGCSNTSLVNMWKDPAYDRGPMTNVLVIAVKKDATMRRIWEDAFVAELGKHGTTATPSYRLFPDALPDSLQASAAVHTNHYDGLIVTHALRPGTETQYVPGYKTEEPVTVRNPWTLVYHTYYKEVYHPGYTEVERVVRYETNVWNAVQNDRMVWTGITNTIDPTVGEQVNREIAQIIVPELAGQRLLPRK